jgi:serine/threonine protein kinase
MLKHPAKNHTDEGGVLKTLRLKHEYKIQSIYEVQKDALVMERLTSSPRILDIFGHCSTSIIVEPMPYEVEEYIVPGKGMAKQEDLDNYDDVKPMNDYTVAEKLQIALDMAESIADLHGFEGGVIVHDDVQLCQWLRNSDDKLKLGDFNRAEVMEWRDTNNTYCTYKNGYVYGNVSTCYHVLDCLFSIYCITMSLFDDFVFT